MPGLNRLMTARRRNARALAVVSETETDMTGFETDEHFANWLGMRVSAAHGRASN